ncbi:MAG: glucose-1-phosphate adenylyltransferase, partial [Clostridia bacterium]|nr:glucose-1-phosphate adenylyltransferase [Clostridia bacterium]
YSILFSNVTVEEGATVRYSIVMPGTVIKAGAVVEYAIVAENAVIDSGAHVGDSPEAMADDLDNWGIAVIGEKVTIGKGAKVNAKQMIDTDLEGEAK